MAIIKISDSWLKKLHGADVISINDMTKQDIISVLKLAEKIESMSYNQKSSILKGKIMASLFFEPSTRTRLSFESAMAQLGGGIIGFADPKASSAVKGETVSDTVKMVERYADVIVIRHPLEGAARVAAEATCKPVINAGDGANQHPTQTLLDLYTIKKTQGNIDGLKIAMVGDLKYGRTVHSLAIALAHFNCEQMFVSPQVLGMPETISNALKEKGVSYSCHEKIEDVLEEADILYMTRIQKERFGDPLEFENLKDIYVLKAGMLRGVKRNFKIMHPLPRVNEISRDVDATPYAHYFEQAANGIPVRQALLSALLGKIR